jgi:hypothetical protein
VEQQNHNGNPQSGGPVVEAEFKCVSSRRTLTSLFNIPGCSVGYKNDNGAFPDGEHKGITSEFFTLKMSHVFPLQTQSNLYIGLDRPRGFQEVQAPSLKDNRHMKVVWLSALRTGPPLPPFLLDDESTPAQKCRRKDVNAKFQ